MAKVPFSPPRMDQKIVDEVTAALYSGWITTGPRTKLFEDRLADYVGISNVVALNSATMGMELALRWFGIGEGDEVIVPAYTYCATANVVVHCGATVVFCDIGEDFNMDSSLLEGLITERTKAIVPVDISGFPADYDEVKELINREEIKSRFRPSTDEQKQLGRILLLSDAAHSIGARYKGKMSGSLADMSSFSFHAVKNLITAEGGAVCINMPEPFDNAEIQKAFKRISLHGQSKDALAKTKVGGWRYDILEPGYKCNMTDLQAAIGLVELERYDNDMLVKRRAIFERYNELLAPYEWAETPFFETEDKVSSYHVYMLRIKGIDEGQRDRMMEAIAAEDVAVNVHFQPVPMFTAYKKLGYDVHDYPASFANYSREITLPVFYDISEEQIGWVIEAVVKAYESL